MTWGGNPILLTEPVVDVDFLIFLNFSNRPNFWSPILHLKPGIWNATLSRAVQVSTPIFAVDVEGVFCWVLFDKHEEPRPDFLPVDDAQIIPQVHPVLD